MFAWSDYTFGFKVSRRRTGRQENERNPIYERRAGKGCALEGWVQGDLERNALAHGLQCFAHAGNPLLTTKPKNPFKLARIFPTMLGRLVWSAHAYLRLDRAGATPREQRRQLAAALQRE